MKHLQYWAVAALPLTSAFLIPPKQQAILHEPKPDLQEEQQETHDHHLFDILSRLSSAVETYSPVQQLTSWIDELADETQPPEEQQVSPPPPPPPPFRRPSPPPYPQHPPSNKSLYDLISENPHTTILARIVHDDSHLVELLNRTAANLTLFAPTDEAFAKIPHHHHDKHRHDDDEDNHDKHGDHDHDHHQPPRELIRAVLKYHLVTAVYSPAELFHAHTLPTLLTEPQLSPKPLPQRSASSPQHDEERRDSSLPQRLSISTTLHGPTLNHYSRILAREKRAANGALYTIDAILLPPPPLLTLATIVPTQFSTLALALHRTGLAARLNHSHPRPHPHPKPGDPRPEPTTNPPSSDPRSHGTGTGTAQGQGGTYFLPTNRAFSRLGYQANAFLFSEHGTPYLRALLEYHLVPRRTLYSDVEYTTSGKIEAVHGLRHFDLETMLDGRTVGVEVANLGPWGGVTVSGVRVGVRDLVVRDGVGHVLTRSVIVPRCEGGEGGEFWEGDGDGEGEMGVEELVGRLRGLVDGGSESDGREEDGEGEQVVWGELHDLLEL
ncbi:FAS1 domain-containing protein [Aspergillus indologenus CBS 114.80]|uniref:FAS1 domain-containing protein n=1 Tax=Aspergillus indologenus CBS 114.80 TaxID=1450541 RepID=A0A2V5J3M2_9EURO|nr:FAS1 domain-containing protein [Aspergillus indologenus CBS 114.80]